VWGLGSAPKRERRMCFAAGAKQHPVPVEQNRGANKVIVPSNFLIFNKWNLRIKRYW